MADPATLGEMNRISTKFVSKMDIAHFNGCIFVSICHILPFKDIITILDDIRLHFEKKKKKHQRALSSQNFKTKHKTNNCSTIITSLGAMWVPKEVKFFRDVNFFGLVRCFSAKIKQTSKNR